MAEMIGEYNPDRDVMYWVHEVTGVNGLVFVKSDDDDTMISIYIQKTMGHVCDIEMGIGEIGNDYKKFRRRCMDWVHEFEHRINGDILGITQSM